jgi:hypothetical protein
LQQADAPPPAATCSLLAEAVPPSACAPAFGWRVDLGSPNLERNLQPPAHAHAHAPTAAAPRPSAASPPAAAIAPSAAAAAAAVAALPAVPGPAVMEWLVGQLPRSPMRALCASAAAECALVQQVCMGACVRVA